jgi:hypothetical protein
MTAWGEVPFTSVMTTDRTRTLALGLQGYATQRWTVTSAHDIVNPQANKCLDVTGNDSANGTRLQIWSCTEGADQKWTVGG